MLFLPWVASTQAVRNDLSRSLLTCILILYRVIWYLSYIDILVYTWWIAILYIFMLNKFCLSPESWVLSHTLSSSLLYHYHTQNDPCTLRPEQNGCLLADHSFECIFFNEKVWIPIKISSRSFFLRVQLTWILILLLLLLLLLFLLLSWLISSVSLLCHRQQYTTCNIPYCAFVPLCLFRLDTSFYWFSVIHSTIPCCS